MGIGAMAFEAAVAQNGFYINVEIHFFRPVGEAWRGVFFQEEKNSEHGSNRKEEGDRKAFHSKKNRRFGGPVSGAEILKKNGAIRECPDGSVNFQSPRFE